MFFLENDIIGLRGLENRDLDGGYADWFNDEDVCAFNSHHRFPVDRKSLADNIDMLNGERNSILLACIHKETGAHVGNISLQVIDLLNRQAEIAFVFGNKDYWGHGYATMAAKLMIDHAFFELGLNRIYFGTSKNNVAMQRVGEKLGFKMGGGA